jgi:hypothetical protein
MRCAAFGVRRRLRLWPLIPIWQIGSDSYKRAQVTDAVEGNNFRSNIRLLFNEPANPSD